MPYIDGFVLAVPTADQQTFIDHANLGNSVFIDLGATRIMECWGDEVPEGKQTDFRMAVKAREDETVVFSWVEWPDKATRDKGWEGMMQDPRMKGPEDNPMAGPRLIYGGFTTLLDTANS